MKFAHWYDAVIFGLIFIAVGGSFVYAGWLDVKKFINDRKRRKLEESDGATTGSMKVVRDSYPFNKSWANETPKDIGWLATLFCFGGLKVALGMSGAWLLARNWENPLYAPLIDVVLGVFLLCFAFGIRIEKVK